VGGKGIHGENSGPVMRDWEMPGEDEDDKVRGYFIGGEFGCSIPFFTHTKKEDGFEHKYAVVYTVILST
jgi:hypothetical protein